MIKGFATPEGTSAWASAHQTCTYSTPGDTELMTSQAGFGCYRVSAGIPGHGAALKHALMKGVNLIDTSTNYADGKSEQLVGHVLKALIDEKTISRSQVIVVSKVGYLQGQNYAYAKQREAQGKPFKELVNFGEGLAHCIHPEFLADQLERSLERLGLETVDFYLLHNPEYYLEWAARQKTALEDARTAYYERIHNAFAWLETQVAKNRIRYYGISSNTLPYPADDPEFTDLNRLWDIAEALSPGHHFRLVQLPLNILEPEAVLEKNQPEGRGVLELAATLPMGVLTNRPLNAFANNRLSLLADVPMSKRLATDEIIKRIQAVSRSESALFRKVMPGLDLPVTMQNRIKEQLAVGDVLKHYWKNFGTYERWRQARSGHLQPRVQGVMDFLSPHRESSEALDQWMAAHPRTVESAFDAVSSIYCETAAREARRFEQIISDADPDWADAKGLSRKAIRAVRSTRGVTAVLVGMRQEKYVDDVMAELETSVPRENRHTAWDNLNRSLQKA